MAKAGKSKGFISQGIHSNVSKQTLKDMKRNTPDIDKMRNKVYAYWAGKNPWITIENPNKEETNKRFIKVKADELWGSPKKRLEHSYMQTKVAK